MSVEIKSFIFFDTEGTGLPQFNGPAKIVEISLVACSVDHFVASSSGETPQIPRVLHKLSLCVNPFKRICEESSRITGLDNYKVEFESKLGVRELEMIKSFVERLQQPVCLVAHNGNGYDFPLLRKEFIKHNVAVPEGLLCVDSLVVFRKIDQARDRERQEDEEVARFIENELREIERLEREEELLTQNLGECSGVKQETKNENDYEILELLECKSIHQKRNETTPKRSATSSSPPRLGRRRGQSSPEETPQKARDEQTPKSRKQLFPEKSEKRRYRLCDIHQRFFGVLPKDTHQAESDCFALMKCALKEARDFLSMAQAHSRTFQEVSVKKCIF
uniref:Putative three prime repair exonuclease 1 n=1 Tax=Phlebotomus kandelakii TaxID=1109342 RepID=A0A6B2EKL9_9DIPT